MATRLERRSNEDTLRAVARSASSASTSPSLQPTAAASSSPHSSATSGGVASQNPECIAAAAKRPQLRGEIRCRHTLMAPADPPNNNTLFGLPPNASLCCVAPIATLRADLVSPSFHRHLHHWRRRRLRRLRHLSRRRRRFSFGHYCHYSRHLRHRLLLHGELRVGEIKRVRVYTPRKPPPRRRSRRERRRRTSDHSSRRTESFPRVSRP